jgi:hypothetical protein
MMKKETEGDVCMLSALYTGKKEKKRTTSNG